MQSTPWTITGAAGETIYGNTHLPASDPTGVAILIHGFLGYKDYGFFPHLAQAFADSGLIAHRFNMSHSGMTNNISTFERPDLFALDTWRHQVDDVIAVIGASVERGELPGGARQIGLPLALFGHSRGAATAILTAAELEDSGGRLGADRIITAAASASCCRMDEQAQARLLDQGYAEVKSNRTGQTLRIGRAWLQDQLDDPHWHDPVERIKSIRCPMLFIHGTDDETVPPSDTEQLFDAAVKRPDSAGDGIILMDDANHVFNTPNPFPPEDDPNPEPSFELEQLVALATRFAKRM